MLSEYLVLGLTVGLFATLAPFTPGLASRASLVNILSYMLPLLVVAIGMTLVMITGGIDLSVTSIIALTSVLGSKLMSSDGLGAPGLAGVFVMLLIGALPGAMNGAIITVLRLPSFIVTLALMMFLAASQSGSLNRKTFTICRGDSLFWVSDCRPLWRLRSSWGSRPI